MLRDDARMAGPRAELAFVVALPQAVLQGRCNRILGLADAAGVAAVEDHDNFAGGKARSAWLNSVPEMAVRPATHRFDGSLC